MQAVELIQILLDDNKQQQTNLDHLTIEIRSKVAQNDAIIEHIKKVLSEEAGKEFQDGQTKETAETVEKGPTFVPRPQQG